MIKDFIKVKDVPEEIINEYKDKIPTEMMDIWKKYGFGYFYDGYLKVINPKDYQKLVQESYFLGDVAIPIFATGFGDLITWEKNNFLGIVKYRYSDNDVISAGMDYYFEDLYDGDFDKEFFDMRKYKAAVKKYGSLEYDECFGYVPLLALGGKESVNNVKKVKIREHIALIASFIGEI